MKSKLRPAVRARGHWPNVKAAAEPLNLIIDHSEKECVMVPKYWAMARAQSDVVFVDRMVRAMAA